MKAQGMTYSSSVLRSWCGLGIVVERRARDLLEDWLGGGDMLRCNVVDLLQLVDDLGWFRLVVMVMMVHDRRVFHVFL